MRTVGHLTVMDGGKRESWVVGHIRPDRKVVAVKCAWCGEWFTEGDRIAHEQGADISHGICALCEDDMMGGDAA